MQVSVSLVISLDAPTRQWVEQMMARIFAPPLAGFAPKSEIAPVRPERKNPVVTPDTGAAAGIAPAAPGSSSLCGPAAPDQIDLALAFSGADGRVWTPERDALLAERYAANVSLEQIRMDLNALPGLPVSVIKAVRNRVDRLKLKRPAAIVAENSPGEAAPVALAVGRPVVWTEARRAYFRTAYPAGVVLDEMLRVMNAMEGEKISGANAIGVQAAKMGLRRPPVAYKLPVPGAATPMMADGSVPIDYEGARRWAAERGLCNGFDAQLDIEMVNTKRLAMGLAPFAVSPRRSAGVAL